MWGVPQRIFRGISLNTVFSHQKKFAKSVFVLLSFRTLKRN
jgi:hypothetical protein